MGWNLTTSNCYTTVVVNSSKEAKSGKSKLVKSTQSNIPGTIKYMSWV